jgi:fatty acid desaturase
MTDITIARQSKPEPEPQRPAAARGSRRQVSDFALLSERIRAAGLLRPRHGYHVVKIAVTVGLIIAGWAVLVAAGPSWWHLVTAVFLGVMFTQLGFVAHDAGHKQILRSRRGSYLLGVLLGNLGIGLGYGWWMDKHSRHHAHPNDTERDPDVGTGVLVFSAEGAPGRRGIAWAVTRFQAYLFFPMLLLEAANLHVSSVRALRRQSGAGPWVEGSLLLAHAGVYLGIVFLVLPPLQAVSFIAVQQGIFGLYMGCSFAPNHKGMPLLSKDDELDYLRRQVLTARNIRGGPVIDYAFGGLNYQIEHHLFPSMPRPSLRRAQPIVRDFCREISVSYMETGLVDSYRQALGHLNHVGVRLPRS